MPVRNKSYHIFSDNSYLAWGLESALEQVADRRLACHITLLNEVSNERNAVITAIAHTTVTLTILAVTSTRVRKWVLCEIRNKEGNVLVISSPYFFRRDKAIERANNIMTIPSNIPVSDIMLSIYSARDDKLSNVVSKTGFIIIDEIYNVNNVKNVSEKTGCSVGYINNIKNRMMSRLGGLVGILGFILCRDLLRVKRKI